MDEEKKKLPLKIMKTKDLPPGRIVQLKGFEKEEQALLWGLNDTGGNTNNREGLWVLYLKGFDAKVEMFNLIKLIKSTEKYQLLHRAEIDKDLLKNIKENKIGEVSADDENDEEKETKFRTFFESMLAYAMDERVSDIHIEKRSTRSKIKMRMNGNLIEYEEGSKQSNTFIESLCRVIYNVYAQNKQIMFNERKYQPASIDIKINGKDLKLRYQSLPAGFGGFDVVMRLLPVGRDDEQYTPLEKLGFTETQTKQLTNIINKPVGALVIAGTTGSGKSTTLKNLLMFLNAQREYQIKIYTIEDPPEYKIPYVTQIPVLRPENEQEVVAAKSPFEAPLTAAMRGDPDVLMIGEVRDLLTGDGLKKATQSGHQVMTTIHATSAMGITERLKDFGITETILGSPEFLNGLTYQKLVKIVCPSCSIPFISKIHTQAPKQEDIELAERLSFVADLEIDDIRIKGKGCKDCKNQGIITREVCTEIIVPDVEMLKLFREGKQIEAKAYWRSLSDDDWYSENMTGKTVMEHALLKMRQGRVSPYDIEAVMGPVDQPYVEREQMEAEIQAFRNAKAEREKEKKERKAKRMTG